MIEKPITIYSLFGGLGGFTTKTSGYSQNSLIVAAKSIRQAFYLANNSVWYDGKVGIIEQQHGYQVTHFNGVTDDHAWFSVKKATRATKAQRMKLATEYVNWLQK